MKRAILKISYECDNRCLFCHAENHKRYAGLAERITFAKIMSLRDRHPDIGSILFSGGEPTINPHIGKYLDFSEKLGFKTGLITNGSKLNSELIIKHLLSKSLEYVYLSLHGSNEDIHNEIAGNENSFRAVEEFLKTQIPENVRLVINCVVNALNIGNLNEMMDYISGFKQVSLLKFSLLEPKGAGKDDFDSLYVNPIAAASAIKRGIINHPEMNIAWDGFSLCQMKGLEDRISNLKTEGIMYMSELIEPKIYDTDDSERKYDSSCEECQKRQSCPGIYPAYIDMYGREIIDIYKAA